MLHDLQRKATSSCFYLGHDYVVRQYQPSDSLEVHVCLLCGALKVKPQAEAPRQLPMDVALVSALETPRCTTGNHHLCHGGPCLCECHLGGTY